MVKNEGPLAFYKVGLYPAYRRPSDAARLWCIVHAYHMLEILKILPLCLCASKSTLTGYPHTASRRGRMRLHPVRRRRATQA